MGIQPGRIVPALRSSSPMHLRGPVYPVPAPRTRPEVHVTSPVPPVPAPRIRPPVRLLSPELPATVFYILWLGQGVTWVMYVFLYCLRVL